VLLFDPKNKPIASSSYFYGTGPIWSGLVLLCLSGNNDVCSNNDLTLVYLHLVNNAATDIARAGVAVDAALFYKMIEVNLKAPSGSSGVSPGCGDALGVVVNTPPSIRVAAPIPGHALQQ